MTIMREEKRAKSLDGDTTTAVYNIHDGHEFLWAAVSIYFNAFIYIPFNTLNQTLGHAYLTFEIVDEATLWKQKGYCFT